MNDIEKIHKNVSQRINEDVLCEDCPFECDGSLPCYLVTMCGALKEKQERKKGCEYCNIGEHKDTLYQISTIGNPTFKLFVPKFCPICGRKLGDDNE